VHDDFYYLFVDGLAPINGRCFSDGHRTAKQRPRMRHAGLAGVLVCLWPVGAGCSERCGAQLPAGAPASHFSSRAALPCAAAAAGCARERGSIGGGLRGGLRGGEGSAGGGSSGGTLRFALAPASARDAFVYGSESPGCAMQASGDAVVGCVCAARARACACVLRCPRVRGRPRMHRRVCVYACVRACAFAVDQQRDRMIRVARESKCCLPRPDTRRIKRCSRG